MAQLRCDQVSDGLRESERVVDFRDYEGRRHFMRVEQEFLSTENDTTFLPIGIVRIDTRKNLVLIELPHEAETGANRLWVKQDQLDKPVVEVFT